MAAHSAFSSIDSFQHGAVERNVGLYAAINGFRLALGRHQGLKKRNARILHGHAVDYWNTKGKLLKALIRGIGFKETLRLARRFAKHLSNDQVTLSIERPPASKDQSIDDVLAWIEESLAQDCPVVLRLRGDRDHITVIGAIDAEWLSFFESGDPLDLPRKSFGLKGSPHRISASAMFRIRATPRPGGGQ